MATTDIVIHDEKDNVGVVVIEKITQNQKSLKTKIVRVGLWRMIRQ